MATSDMSGVSLLTAIRQFSDPVAWAEFELLLGLGGGDTEARAGWNADDWKRHDFQVSLSLEGVRLRSTEHIITWHRWARLRLAFKKRLQSGELVATGYIKPVKLTDSRMAVPADKWRFLELDFWNEAAAGEGLEIVSVLIDRAEFQASRSPDERVAHRPPIQKNNAKRAIDKIYPQGVPSDMKREALTAEVNTWLRAQKLGMVSSDTIDRALGKRR